MTGYTDVLGVEELADGAMTKVEVDGATLLLAHVGGSFYAAQSRCSHLGGNLAKGTLEGTIVQCPLHGSRFDLTDGSVVRWTGFTGAVQTVAETLRHPRPLRTYDVRVEGGRVLVGSERLLPGAG
ncbi:MAG: Rieske 2Fe-2S domain-containing protein [Coriobacteriia bacterium]|nr:Rieske 2Fe-2S domain-containing protein [Coriobacteriia bacterium]